MIKMNAIFIIKRAYIIVLSSVFWAAPSFSAIPLISNPWQYKCDNGYYLVLSDDEKAAKIGMCYDDGEPIATAYYLNGQRFSGLALGRVNTNPERREEMELYVYEGIDDHISMGALLLFNRRTNLLQFLSITSLSQSKIYKCQPLPIK